MTTRDEVEAEVPDWIWTSDIVLGWCDQAGCGSVGHKANGCRLAKAFADHLRRLQDRLRVAEAERDEARALAKAHEDVAASYLAVLKVAAMTNPEAEDAALAEALEWADENECRQAKTLAGRHAKTLAAGLRKARATIEKFEESRNHWAALEYAAGIRAAEAESQCKEARAENKRLVANGSLCRCSEMESQVAGMEKIVESSLRAFEELSDDPGAGERIVQGCVDLANAVKEYRLAAHGASKEGAR